MKNADLWRQHEEYTKQLSENCRKLGFAAAAIAWLFRSEAGLFPGVVLGALGFTVLFFLADLLQYLMAALVLRFWTRSQEKKRWRDQQSIEGDYQKPAWLDCPAFSMWILKFLCLVLAYLLLAIHVGRTMFG